VRHSESDFRPPGNPHEPHFAPVASDVIMATLHASTGSEVALVPWSMTHVKFPGVTYVPLKTRAPAFMDLHCFYLREQRSPLIDAMLETVVAYRNEAKRAARNQAR